MFLNVSDLQFKLFILFSVLIFGYFLYTRIWQYWPRRGVSHVKPLPIFGNFINLLLFKESFGDVLWYIYKSCSDKFVGFYFLVSPYLLIKDPEVIKTILIKDFGCFRNRMLSSSLRTNRTHDPISSEALCVLDYPEWKNSRATLRTAFSTTKLKATLVSMNLVGDNMIECVKKSLVYNCGEIDAKELTTKFTTDVLVHFVYGVDAKSFEENGTPFRAVSDGFFNLNLNRGVQFACGLFYPNLSKMCGFSILKKSSSLFLREAFRQAIAHRRESGINRHDLLDHFIQLQRTSKDYSVDDDELAGQAASFFLAGNETTSATISFTLHELSVNTDVQDVLRKEIFESFRNDFNNITYEKISDMKYLNMVVYETLRKYPPLSFLDRRTVESYTLQESNTRIDKGAGVFISLLGLHHDPNYFPNPSKYSPERFNTENIAKLNPYTYMPFGTGPHSCIAGRFGILATKVALIHIVMKFEICNDSSRNVAIKFDPKCPTLIPLGGLPITFKMLEN